MNKINRIIFATGNAGKIREIRMIMEDLHTEVLSMREAGILIDVEENGSTYEENAMLKARAAAACREAEGAVVMADDS